MARKKDEERKQDMIPVSPGVKRELKKVAGPGKKLKMFQVADAAITEYLARLNEGRS